MFKFEKILGEGSSGIVYSAKHLKMRYSCAVKLIPKNRVYGSPMTSFFEQQLLNEFYALSKIRHKNILTIYELLHDENFFIIVSELVKDGDLI